MTIVSNCAAKAMDESQGRIKRDKSSQMCINDMNVYRFIYEVMLIYLQEFLCDRYLFPYILLLPEPLIHPKPNHIETMRQSSTQRHS
jgi:hypothetical protein